MAAETGVPDARELYDRAACGLLVTAADGTIVVVNDTFCRWIGLARDELVGRRKLQELLTVGARIFHQTHWAPLLQMQGSVAEVKLDLVHAGGEIKPMILNAVSRTTDGVVRHEIAAFGAEDRHRYERELLHARRRAEELHTRSMETQRALVDAQAELDVQRRAAEDRALFAELLSAPEGQGARAVVNAEPGRVRYLEVEDPGVVLDLDTPAELEAAGFAPPPGDRSKA